MTTTHRRRHRLARIALVTAVAIFSAGGCLSFFGGGYSAANSPLDRGADIEARTNNGKTALLIANAGYDHLPRLRTPLQEARQLGAALKRIGFEVQMLTDGSQDEMREALYRFEERVRERGGTALFHYGGHGVQVNGVNYLLPVDRNIPDERRVRSLAISADEISGALQAARSTANIVILDACRDNPLPRETRTTDVRGLAPINDPPPNTLIVFAAGGGEVARDGLFTPTLLKYIEEPGIEITEMLRRVRGDVYEASGGKQRTADYNQLFTEVYLAGGARLDRGADIEAGDVPLPIAEEFPTGKVERLDFFRRIGLIIGETSDESIFMVTPLIGYRPDDDVTLQELIQRAPQIKERIEIYFSSRRVDEFQDADDRARVKRDLIQEINQMMENDIRDVVFDDYRF